MDMNIYLATWLEDSQRESLTKAKSKNRLMSYYFISQGAFDIKKYVTTGRLKPNNKSKQKKFRRRN